MAASTNLTIQSKLQYAQEEIEYHFKDPLLLWEALQVVGSGVLRIGDRQIRDGNKNLAVLGDSVMATVLCTDWTVANTSKGELTKLHPWKLCSSSPL